jgi:hypothetical protein
MPGYLGGKKIRKFIDDISHCDTYEHFIVHMIHMYAAVTFVLLYIHHMYGIIYMLLNLVD